MGKDEGFKFNSTFGTDDPCSSDSDWENEDPNLLNNPELLYQEAALLSLPNRETGNEYAEIMDAINIVRDMMLGNSKIFESLSTMDEVRGTPEAASAVVTGIVESVEANNVYIEKYCMDMENLVWNEEAMAEIFGKEGVDAISDWKNTLNEFLESFSKMRKYIPEETFQISQEEAEKRRRENEQLNRLASFIDTFKEFTNVLEKLKLE